jgi:histidine triad (HIT) family protein
VEDSIFTKIIKGEIPCHKIYEDDKTFVFLDIHPKIPGHILVIPKKQVAYVWDLPGEDYQALMATVQKVAMRLREVLQPRFVGSQIIGVDVPHAHVHVFPFDTMDQYHQAANMSLEPDHDVLTAMAKRLAF